MFPSWRQYCIAHTTMRYPCMGFYEAMHFAVHLHTVCRVGWVYSSLPTHVFRYVVCRDMSSYVGACGMFGTVIGLVCGPAVVSEDGKATRAAPKGCTSLLHYHMFYSRIAGGRVKGGSSWVVMVMVIHVKQNFVWQNVCVIGQHPLGERTGYRFCGWIYWLCWCLFLFYLFFLLSSYLFGISSIYR